jgi:hypothetical protein
MSDFPQTLCWYKCSAIEITLDSKPKRGRARKPDIKTGCFTYVRYATPSANIGCFRRIQGRLLLNRLRLLWGASPSLRTWSCPFVWDSPSNSMQDQTCKVR